MIAEALSATAINIICHYAINIIENKISVSNNVDKEVNDAFEESLSKWSKHEVSIPKKTRLKEYLKSSKKDNVIIDKQPEFESFKVVFQKQLNKKNEASRYFIQLKLDEIGTLLASHSSNDDKLLELIKNLDSKLENKKHKQYLFKEDAHEKKSLFINEEVIIEDHCMERYVYEPKKNEHNFFNQEPIKKEKLSNFINNNYSNKLFILEGQPGSGKTYEIIKLAKKLFEDKNTDLIPYFSDLKNFTTSDNLQSFLNIDETLKFKNVIFILDGLDEIKDLENFLSKFNTFIRGHQDYSIQFLFSCRSNILLQVTSEFNDFILIKLLPLNIIQAKTFVEKVSNKKIEIKDLTSFQQLNLFLESPFKLKILSEYLKANNILTHDTSKLWSLYADNLLKKDSEKFKKKKFPKLEIKKNAEKLAIVNELQHKNIFKEEEAFKVFQENEEITKLFLECGLINHDTNNENYFFLHKEIQEYLSATKLINYDFAKILEILKIEDLNRVHPSMFNTASFVFGIVENELLFEKLHKWFSKYEPLLIFKGDKNRTSQFRNPFFQSFFKNEIEDKNIYIGNISNINLNEVGYFADTEENTNFLFQYVIDGNYTDRIRISALSVLEKTINFINNNRIEALISLLKKENESAELKSTILQLFETWKLYSTNQIFCKELMNALIETKEITHSAITSVLLRIIYKSDKVDENIDFLINEIEYEFENKTRKYDDGVHRLIRYSILESILKVNDEFNFIKLLLKVFKSISADSYLDEKYGNKLVKKYLKFEEDRINLIIDLISFLGFQKICTEVNYSKILQAIFEKTKNKKSVVDFVSKNQKSENYGMYFWGEIMNDNYFDILINEDFLNKHDLKQIEKLRNFLFINKKNQLAIRLENEAEKRNLKIKPYQFLSYENIISQQLQEDLNCIFNIDKAIIKINRYFIENKLSQITKKAFFTDLYESNIIILGEAFRYTKFSYKVISNVFRQTDHKYVDKDIIINNLRENIFKISLFIEYHKKYKSNFDKIFENYLTIIQTDLNNYTKEFKKEELLLKKSKKIQFINNGFSKLRELNHIFYILNNFDKRIDIDESFLLYSLKYYEWDNYLLDNDLFVRLLSRINELNRKKKVIFLLENDNLIHKYRYANYVLDNNYLEGYETIRNLLLSGDISYQSRPILQKLVSNTNSKIIFELLKKPKNENCWEALNLALHEFDTNHFHKKEYIKFSKAVLQDNQYNSKFPIALSVLFQFNHSDAIDFIIADINDRFILLENINISAFSAYSARSKIKESTYLISDLIEYFDKNKSLNNHKNYNRKKFIVSYSMNLSEKELELDNLDMKLKSLSIKYELVNDDLFYFINKLRNDIRENYAFNKSKPYSFSESLDKIKGLAN